MRVLVAGATGAVGTHLVPQLAGARPRRSSAPPARRRAPPGCARLGAERVGARPARRVRGARRRRRRRPDVIVHQATALTGLADIKHFDQQLRRHEPPAHGRAPTTCWPRRGPPASGASSRRASPAGRPAAAGGPVTTEDDPLDPEPVPAMRESLAAIRHLEDAVVAAGGVALRYGGLYGVAGDAQIEIVRKRRFPIVGDGGGVWSFVHLDDAAAATVLALERGAPGVYNVVDDDPAPVARVAARAGRGAGREAAAPRAALARAAGGGRGRRRDDDRGAGRLERQGEARARLDAALPELAAGLPRLLRGRR